MAVSTEAGVEIWDLRVCEVVKTIASKHRPTTIGFSHRGQSLFLLADGHLSAHQTCSDVSSSLAGLVVADFRYARLTLALLTKTTDSAS